MGGGRRRTTDDECYKHCWITVFLFLPGGSQSLSWFVAVSTTFQLMPQEAWLPLEKKSIYWHYLCLAFEHKMGRVTGKQKICSFSHQYKPVGLVILYWKYSPFLEKPVLPKKRWPKELKLSNIVFTGCFIDDLTIVLLYKTRSYFICSFFFLFVGILLTLNQIVSCLNVLFPVIVEV